MGRHDLAPWLFIAPAAIIFAIYVVIPIFQSFWLSLFDWDGITVDKQFIGLANYEQLFEDEQFWTSLRNNVYWLIFFLLGPVGGVAIAIFLNQQLPGMRLVKSLFFFPSCFHKWSSGWYSRGFTIPSTAFSASCCESLAFRPSRRFPIRTRSPLPSLLQDYGRKFPTA